MTVEGEILNYTLRLTVLGSLFVGSGETLEKSEYVVDRRGNKLYVMDKRKMFEGLQRLRLLTAFTQAIMGERFDLFKFCLDKKIQREEYTKWAKYSYLLPEDFNFSNTRIMTITKDPYGFAYIPGSSVKGALRNAVLNSVLMNSEEYSHIAETIEAESKNFKGRNRYLSNEARDIDAKAFYTLRRPGTKPHDMVNDIFSGLRIGDSKPISLNRLALCPKIDLLPDGPENDINLHRECLAPDTEVELPVEIDTRVFPYDAEGLCKCIRDMYDLEKKVFLSKFNDADLLDEKETVLYLGGGSGFVSKTALYALYKDTERGLRVATTVLDKSDSTKRDKKGNVKKVGDHLRDPYEYGVAPHMLKCTEYKGKLYDFGLCRVEFEVS